MPRRKKDNELFGFSDVAAIRLYEQGKALLEERGQWNMAAAAVLRGAAQWQQEASDIARAISRELRRRDGEGGEKSPARIRAMIKNKALCEGEMRRSLDDLLLLPRLPRGRPPKGEAEDAPDDGTEDAWDAFDAGAEGGGGP